MRILKIREMVLGEGEAKICVPIVEEREEAILAAAEKAALSGADCIEWRMDFYRADLSGSPAGREEPEIFAGIAGRIRERIGETPLLLTLRSEDQGGRSSLSKESLLRFQEQLIACLQRGEADILDVEHPFRQARGEAYRILARKAKEKGIYLLLSQHFCSGTPSEEEIEAYLRQAHEGEADIVKLAVMPHSKEEVRRLKCTVKRFCAEKDRKPMIIIAMSDIGRESRIFPRRFFSDLTFACIGKPSAPGQVELSELKTLLYPSLSAYGIIKKETRKQNRGSSEKDEVFPLS
ncbi:MAG: type I 3-dehydroquinate dehydratase [Peptostreptococcaceae bacterium]|nr:type I 3-dehydroquinate dehydratase [Peptostreptococcaceae bacterium]